ARIRASLRRTQGGADAGVARAPEQLSVDDVTLDLGRRVVLRAGAPVVLTAVEFSLLELLMRAAGSVVRRDDLARGALGRGLLPSIASLTFTLATSARSSGRGPTAGGGSPRCAPSAISTPPPRSRRRRPDGSRR